MKFKLSIVLVALLAGCSTAKSVPTEPTPSISPTAKVYSTNQDLAADLNAQGVPCTNYEDVGSITRAIQLGNCNFSSDNELVLSIYANAVDAADSPNNLLRFWIELTGETTDIHMVVGPNWSINCDNVAEYCQEISDKLHGRLVQF